MAMTAKLWSVNAAASELGRDRRTVAKALDGVKADGRIGDRPAWLLQTIINALSDRATPTGGALDPAQERARKDRAWAEKIEEENMRRRGELVAVGDVAQAVADEYARVRSRLLAIPARAAPRAAVLKTPQEVMAVLEDEIASALRELASDGPSSDFGNLPGRGA